MELTGAQALIKSLENEGVEVIFGLPGGAILPVYDPEFDEAVGALTEKPNERPRTAH